MLLRQGIALDHAAVIEPLTGNTAVLERADASVHLVAHALCLGVDGLVENDENSVALVVSHAAPEEWGCDRDRAETGEEPHEVHAADIGHDDENKDIAQRNAEVVGDKDNFACQQHRNTRELHDGQRR